LLNRYFFLADDVTVNLFRHVLPSLSLSKTPTSIRMSLIGSHWFFFSSRLQGTYQVRNNRPASNTNTHSVVGQIVFDATQISARFGKFRAPCFAMFLDAPE